MEENSVWIIGIVTLAAGALIGYLMGRSSDNSGQQKLVDQLNEAQQELSEYKGQVNGHFEKTAELVNNLTESYREVHQHLAQGSESLCKGAHSPAQLDNNTQPKIAELTDTEQEEQIPTVTDEITPAPEEPEAIEPPRDYAPKSPDEEGTLSEKFGLKKEQDANEEEDIPPVLKDHVPNNHSYDSDSKPSA